MLYFRKYEPEQIYLGSNSYYDFYFKQVFNVMILMYISEEGPYKYTVKIDDDYLTVKRKNYYSGTIWNEIIQRAENCGLIF